MAYERTAFVNLRNILADLYPDQTSAQRIAFDAGIDTRRIEFTAHAINNWHAVLQATEKTGRDDDLLGLVLEEYGKNRTLRDAYVAYHNSRTGIDERVALQREITNLKQKIEQALEQQKQAEVEAGSAKQGLEDVQEQLKQLEQEKDVAQRREQEAIRALQEKHFAEKQAEPILSRRMTFAGAIVILGIASVWLGLLSVRNANQAAENAILAATSEAIANQERTTAQAAQTAIAIAIAQMSVTPTITSIPAVDATGTADTQRVSMASAATLTALLPETPEPTPTFTDEPASTHTPTSTAINTPTTVVTRATWTNPKDGAIYVYIPAGEFKMGRGDDEHKVNVDEFWIMQTEVTNGQYKQCVEAGECTEPDETNTRWNDPVYADHPVTNVKWNQVNEYAKWAGGWLPTEAEWEKACRGTDGRVYPWGNEEPNEELLNYDRNAGDTVRVGSYPEGASPYNVLDMAGNVREWTSSLWGQYWEKPQYGYPYDPNDGREDPEAEGLRGMRGGGWGSNADNVGCSVRFRNLPDFGDNGRGFRIIASPSTTED